MAKKTTRTKGNRMPALKVNEKTKEFTVAPGFSIGGNDNARYDEGDLITLSHPQAVYMKNLGAITFELPEFGDDNDNDASNTAKATSGGEADGGGTKPSGRTATKKVAL